MYFVAIYFTTKDTKVTKVYKNNYPMLWLFILRVLLDGCNFGDHFICHE